jgi:hypothetical protein
LVLPVSADESKTSTDTVEYMNLDPYRVGGAKTGVWLGQLLVFHSDRSDPQYMMPTARNVWRKGTTELRLVLSRDAGKTWQRVCDKAVWLPCSPEPHGYDRLVFAQYPIRMGNEMRLYHSVYDGDHLIFKRDGSLEFVPQNIGIAHPNVFHHDVAVALDDISPIYGFFRPNDLGRGRVLNGLRVCLSGSERFRGDNFQILPMVHVNASAQHIDIIGRQLENGIVNGTIIFCSFNGIVKGTVSIRGEIPLHRYCIFLSIQHAAQTEHYEQQQ